MHFVGSNSTRQKRNFRSKFSIDPFYPGVVTITKLLYNNNNSNKWKKRTYNIYASLFDYSHIRFRSWYLVRAFYTCCMVLTLILCLYSYRCVTFSIGFLYTSILSRTDPWSVPQVNAKYTAWQPLRVTMMNKLMNFIVEQFWVFTTIHSMNNISSVFIRRKARYWKWISRRYICYQFRSRLWVMLHILWSNLDHLIWLLSGIHCSYANKQSIFTAF